MNFLKNGKKLNILGPMVGYSDHGWRILARKYGADICYTEMVHSEIFLRNNSNPENNQWFTTSQKDRPLVIQICGNCPKKMSTVALILEPFCDAIDINFGCPQNIARRGNYGCFLQNDWEKIAEIVSTVSKSISKPLFCKIRIFEEIEKSIEYAKIFEKNGASLLAVHGRKIDQKAQFSGFASWKHLREIKKNLKIPVIANGNILDKNDIIDCLDYTGCDGVMVAETHIFNPCIFSDDEKNAIEIFKEYFEICKAENILNILDLKNHGFKLFSAVFEEFPFLRCEFTLCFCIENIFSFLAKMEAHLEINGRFELLKLKYKLREKEKTQTSFFMID